jgi:hypothetical protein
MFGVKPKSKRSHNFKVQKPETRSRLDKVIDILDAAVTKDNRPKAKKAVKQKPKTNKSDWNPQINW